MTKTFDWSEFLRIAGGIFFIGAGLTIVGSSKREIPLLLGGFALIGIGIAAIASK